MIARQLTDALRADRSSVLLLGPTMTSFVPLTPTSTTVGVLNSCAKTPSSSPS